MCGSVVARCGCGTCVRCAGTATGRKGSMWAAVPAAAACDALAPDEDEPPLGPGQLPPRNAHLPPLHAEINISIIMVKGQLELEVSSLRLVPPPMKVTKCTSPSKKLLY